MAPGTLLFSPMFKKILNLIARPFGGITRMVERKITDVLLDHASLQSDSLDTVIEGYVTERIAIPNIDEATAIKKIVIQWHEQNSICYDGITEAVVEHFVDEIRVDDDEVKEACIESTMENMYINEDDIAREITEHFADDINIDADDIKTEVTDGLRETLQPQLDAFVAEVQDGYLTSPDMTSKLLDAIAAKFTDYILSNYGEAGKSGYILDRIVEDTSKGIQQVMIDAFAAGRRAKAIAMSYDASADAANEAANAASKAAAGAKSALKG